MNVDTDLNSASVFIHLFIHSFLLFPWEPVPSIGMTVPYSSIQIITVVLYLLYVKIFHQDNNVFQHFLLVDIIRIKH